MRAVYADYPPWLKGMSVISSDMAVAGSVMKSEIQTHAFRPSPVLETATSATVEMLASPLTGRQSALPGPKPLHGGTEG